MDAYTQSLIFSVWESLPKKKQELTCGLSREQVKETEVLEDRLAQYRQVLPELFALIKNKDLRQKLYWAIPGMLEAEPHPETVAVLLNAIGQEKNKNLISVQLEKLKYMEIDTSASAEAVLAYTHHKEWRVRYAALQLFTLWSSHHAEAEQRVIEILNETDRDFECLYAALALLRVGTPTAVEPLKAAVGRISKRDAVEICLSVIGELGGKTQRAYFESFAAGTRDKKLRAKAEELLQHYA